jgi:hypothetical protein
VIDMEIQGVSMPKKLLGSSRLSRKWAATFAMLVVLLSTLVGASVPASAVHATVAAPKLTATNALSGSSFERGYIISDYLFYQKDAMTQAQIQTFLDSECPTHNCIDNLKTTTADRAASNMCPTAYAGATNETTAAIIYKVEQSCGISAKVILVTLQKEEGLVTKQNPSSAALKIAMGYGCPDTAPCDSLYYGLFNQIYDASSQFKRYGLRTSDNVSFRTKYQIGVPYAIQYSPNAACGTVKVTVQDMATTALYYYTPYTPDAAALNNLGGTGDSCSSYGNRNFWVYWNNWFGSPLIGQGDDKIDSEYVEEGGATGALGAAVGSSTCSTNSTSCSQTYANGLIYWSKSGGAIVVVGALYAGYVAAGGLTGVLGAPTAKSSAKSSAHGNGATQQFSHGVLYSSAAGSFAVTGVAKTEYAHEGGIPGVLGWPTSNASCTGTVCLQTFQYGSIAYSSSVAKSLLGGFAAGYVAAGGTAGSLGYPTAEQANKSNKAHGNGATQQFSHGVMYSSAAGVFAVTGVAKTDYANEGGVAGVLGWPTSNASCTGTACVQTFQHGTIDFTSSAP